MPVRPKTAHATGSKRMSAVTLTVWINGMDYNDYTITPDQVLQLLAGFPLPAAIEINPGETNIDLPLFISTNSSRMYCRSAILEKPARRNMMAMARMIQMIINHSTQ